MGRGRKDGRKEEREEGGREGRKKGKRNATGMKQDWKGTLVGKGREIVIYTIVQE